MVACVSARIDGTACTLARGGDGCFTVSVPADLSDGMYVLELWPEDEAGNVGYWSGVLYLCDGRLTGVHVLPGKYLMRLLPPRCAVRMRVRGCGHAV